MMDFSKINTGSFRFECVDLTDYPDFTDATLIYAEWKSGEPLCDDELKDINENHKTFLLDFILGDALW